MFAGTAGLGKRLGCDGAAEAREDQQAAAEDRGGTVVQTVTYELNP